MALPSTSETIADLRQLHARALDAHLTFEVRKLTLSDSESELRKTLTSLTVKNEPKAPPHLRVRQFEE
jgi:hypothetical protein